MKKIIIAIFVLASTYSIKAQSDSLNSPEKISDHFFYLMMDNTDNAIDFLFATNPFFDIANMPQLQDIKGKLKKLIYFGNLHGYELSSRREICPSLVMLTYIAKYTRQPIRVNIYFYKPDKNWQVQTFKFDEDFKADFEKVPEQFVNQPK